MKRKVLILLVLCLFPLLFVGCDISGLVNQGDSQGPQGIQGEQGPQGDKGDTGEQGPQGEPGKDGLTPYIGSNGNWWIGDTDTGVTAEGQGTPGQDGTNGEDGLTPYIGSNGNWWIGNTDTGVTAEGQGTPGQDGIAGEDGQDGLTPYIGSNGNWWIGDTDTGVKAEGTAGTPGQDGIDGEDGLTPYIGSNGNWWMGSTDTGVKAEGVDGTSSITGMGKPTSDIGKNGDSYINLNTWDYYVKENGEWIFIERLDPEYKYSKVQTTYVYAYEGETVVLPSEVFAYSIENNQLEITNVTWNVNISLSELKRGEYVFVGEVADSIEKAYCHLIVNKYYTKLKTVDGFVAGLQSGEEATVTLYNAEYIETIKTVNGSYKFENVPNGEYEIRAEASNYYASENKVVEIKDVDTEKKTLFDNIAHVYFELEYVKDYSYYYSWNSNKYYFGEEVSSSIPVPYTVELNGYKYEIQDNSAAITLNQKYNVILENSNYEWSYQNASGLLDCFNRLGIEMTKGSVWTVSDDYLENDMIIERGENIDKVTVSKYALKYSSALSGTLNGQKGTFFSKRLYTVVTRYVTNEGKNTDIVDEIFRKNFAVSIYVPDYEYLTRNTTGETAEQFRMFTPEELLDILQMFEEMPTGFHKIDGFDYIIRRQNGHPHPIYPSAAAVTWPTEGYIEFMSFAFESSMTYFDRYRLIIHEKAHMVWHHVFSDSIRDEWAKVGGWYLLDENDPESWVTSKTTEFVTQYAHDHNPNEDMAESMAYYIIDDAALKARAPKKYEFLEKYVFNSTKYVNEVREDLTFEVYNLWPDYDYPGMITKVEITSNSGPYDNKLYEITLTLNHIEGFQDGCTGAWMRVCCLDSVDKYVDVGLSPVDGNQHLLRGYFEITNVTQSGYWAPESIGFSDEAGNKRYVGPADFGFKLYVDNPLEDLEKPVLVDGSINIEVIEELVHNDKYEVFHKYIVDISLEVEDENLRQYNGVVMRIDPIEEKGERFMLDSWGQLEEDGKYHIYYEFDDFSWNTEYAINFFTLIDDGLNSQGYGRFSLENNIGHENIYFTINSLYEDIEAPILDLNRISVSAEPTNPDAPNGETIVEFNFYMKEEQSGFDYVYGSFELVDPLGELHGEYIYDWDCEIELQEDGFYKVRFTLVLPQGSYPGKWGVYSMTLIDIVQNARRYDFMEIVHFEIEG